MSNFPIEDDSDQFKDLGSDPYLLAFEFSPSALFMLSDTGRILNANLKATQIMGLEKSDLFGKDFFEYTYLEDKAQDQAFIDFLSNKEGNLYTVEKRIVHSLGTFLWVKQSVNILKDTLGYIKFFIISLENISILKAREELSIQKEDIFTAMFHSNNAIKLLISLDGSIKDANKAASDFYGYSREQLVRMRISEINTLTQDQIKAEMLKAKNLNQQYFHFPHKLANGEIRIVEVHSGPVKLGQDSFLFSIIHDITNNYKINEKTGVSFYTDLVTGVPNRLYLIQLLEKLINEKKEPFCLIWLDLDFFKKLREESKPGFPDELLKQVAKRMVSAFPYNSIFARMDKDEFVLVWTGDLEIETLADLFEGLQNLFKLPFVVFGETFKITCSMGLVLFPEHGKTISQLLENAKSSIYQAKLKGRNRIEVHGLNLDTKIKKSLEKREALRKAFTNNEFELNFQPIIQIQKKKILSVECLLRWSGAREESIEIHDLIVILGKLKVWKQIFWWTLEESIKTFLAWKKEGNFIDSICINISLHDFLEEDFLNRLNRIIKQYHFLPNYLEFDLSSHELHDFSIEAFAQIHKLHEMGIRCNLDHFGTGQLDFEKLKNFPIQRLKLDYSLLGKNFTGSYSFLGALLGLGRAIDSDVIVLGLETEEQKEDVVKLGFQFGQGFLYGNPVPFSKAFLYWRGLGLIT